MGKDDKFSQHSELLYEWNLKERRARRAAGNLGLEISRDICSRENRMGIHQIIRGDGIGSNVAVQKYCVR